MGLAQAQQQVVRAEIERQVRRGLGPRQSIAPGVAVLPAGAPSSEKLGPVHKTMMRMMRRMLLKKGGGGMTQDDRALLAAFRTSTLWIFRAGAAGGLRRAVLESRKIKHAGPAAGTRCL